MEHLLCVSMKCERKVIFYVSNVISFLCNDIEKCYAITVGIETLKDAIRLTRSLREIRYLLSTNQIARFHYAIV